MGSKNRNQAPAAADDSKKDEVTEQSAAEQSSENETLLGSNSQPAIVKVAGFDVELGQAVKGAFEKTGLTVAEWNALSQDAREGFIAAVIDPQPDQAGDRGPVDNADVAQAAGEGAESLNQDQGVSNTVSADPDGLATAAGQDAPEIAGETAAEDGTLEVVDDPVHPPPSVALITGVLQDYERVLGVGKHPTEQQGERAQKSLVHYLRVLTGDTREEAAAPIETILAFFAENQDGLTSEAHLSRFVSGGDLALLLSVRERAVQTS